MNTLMPATFFPASKCPPLWANGPDVMGYHSFPNKSLSQPGPTRHTQSPVTTGSSVFAMKYEGGVIVASDTLGSYGSLARFPDLQRIFKVNETTVVAAGGDYADYQFLSEIIKQKQIEEDCKDDGFNMKPKALFAWLTRVMYNRRSKFDPLWNTFLVCGMQDKEPFLGYVNLQGTAFQETVLATGMGSDLALPIMRNAMEKKSSLQQPYSYGPYGGATGFPRFLRVHFSSPTATVHMGERPVFPRYLSSQPPNTGPYGGARSLPASSQSSQPPNTGPYGGARSLPASSQGGLLSYEEAKDTLLQCVRLSYLRDCRSWPKYHIAKIDATGSSVEGPFMIDSNWEYARNVRGYE